MYYLQKFAFMDLLCIIYIVLDRKMSIKHLFQKEWAFRFLESPTRYISLAMSDDIQIITETSASDPPKDSVDYMPH
ncbi:hypothetical protein DdX_06751 [Ditylenchus destructor]|uniref:Uncharacterized protein n=1 Tax=Ditylenchus destructor TaxID=166010 RepID=A0AAD4NB11_9BILA|nr:hypothetical protein DdX_06751 [Ditylenchus destructor]